MNTADSIQYLKKVGPKRASAFLRLDVRTVGQLLHLYPRTYLDYSAIIPIAKAPQDAPCVVCATVLEKLPQRRIAGGRTLQKVRCCDDSALLNLTYFNNPYVLDKLELGKEYLFYGKVSGNFTEREMVAPQFLPKDTKHLLTPIYPQTEGLSSTIIASCVAQALSEINTLPDPLTQDMLEKFSLPPKWAALRMIHQPNHMDELKQARRRLIFEELLCLQLGLLSLRGKEQHQTGAPMHTVCLAPFTEALPFSPTKAQTRAIQEIAADMQKPSAMNRLLQGDVGSGKTLVAAAAIYFSAQNGYQSVLMAPTEILAVQHQHTLEQFLSPFGIKTALLTGSIKGKAREGTLASIESGDIQLVVGTHAVLSEPVQYSKLGLALTDEQHRFGVRQRGLLAQKAERPHLLVMSATPIPRTLALLMFGDLDISVLDEMPPGRTPVKTHLVREEKRRDMFGFLADEIDKGRQVYIVCPLIEEGENGLQAAATYAEEIARPLLSGARVGLMHGKLKAAEKNEIMRAFQQGELDVLVSTTVIEVGVDVPNASVIVIEDAERYGLSALHQLRGRVGRGSALSYCFLVSSHLSETARERLLFLCKTTDGFDVAKFDLETRGPGDFFGNRQHGLPNLHLANLATDTRILKAAQETAIALYQKDPTLQNENHALLKHAVQDLFSSTTAMN